MLRQDSYDHGTFDILKKILGSGELDFLFIDSDHRYEGVKKDFEMYSRLVRICGIVAFRDIVEHPRETKCEVSNSWREIRNSYRHQEIVKDWNQE